MKHYKTIIKLCFIGVATIGYFPPQDSPNRCLVSTVFDVSPDSTVEEMQEKEEVRIPWGTGIVGHVAKTGEMLNIPDAYQVHHNIIAVMFNIYLLIHLPEACQVHDNIIAIMLNIHLTHTRYVRDNIGAKNTIRML